MQGKTGKVLSTLGMVCSTWVFMSRGSTYRSFLNPEGNTSNEKVQLANRMLCRSVLLCLLTVCMNGVYILEQPLSSLAEYHPRFQWLGTITNASNSEIPKQSR